jgi:hypothetical protein
MKLSCLEYYDARRLQVGVNAVIGHIKLHFKNKELTSLAEGSDSEGGPQCQSLTKSSLPFPLT